MKQNKNETGADKSNQNKPKVWVWVGVFCESLANFE
jgi:hypothetical protein